MEINDRANEPGVHSINAKDRLRAVNIQDCDRYHLPVTKGNEN